MATFQNVFHCCKSRSTPNANCIKYNDHRPESDNNIEAQGIADIITVLAQTESEDKETINKSAFTDMTATIKATPRKNRGNGKRGTLRKRNNNN